MQIERQIKKLGSHSLIIILPPDMARYLGLVEGSEVILQDEQGEVGRSCSFWKKRSG